MAQPNNAEAPPKSNHYKITTIINGNGTASPHGVADTHSNRSKDADKVLSRHEMGKDGITISKTRF